MNKPSKKKEVGVIGSLPNKRVEACKCPPSVNKAKLETSVLPPTTPTQQNKPSKKTEWEKYVEGIALHFNAERTPDNNDWMFPAKPDYPNLRRTQLSYARILNYIFDNPPDLLHQRDNEIREWARKNTIDIRGGEQSAGGDPAHWIYYVRLDDLLTYLSNRKV